MTIELWDWLEHLDLLVGADFPAADEDALRRCGLAWADVARDLRSCAVDAAAAGGAVQVALGGAAGDSFARTWQPFGGHDGYFDQLATLCDQLADACEQTALDVEYAKLEYIGALVTLAGTLAGLGAFLWFFGLSALAMPGAISAAQFTIRLVLARLVAGILAGAAFNVGLDVAAQVIQFADGHRHGWDELKTLSAARDGAMYGAIGGAMFLGVGRLLPPSAGRGATALGLGGAVVGTGVAGGVVVPIVDGQGLTLDGVVRATVSGTVGGVGALHSHRSTPGETVEVPRLDTLPAATGVRLAVGGEPNPVVDVRSVVELGSVVEPPGPGPAAPTTTDHANPDGAPGSWGPGLQGSGARPRDPLPAGVVATPTAPAPGTAHGPGYARPVQAPEAGRPEVGRAARSDSVQPDSVQPDSVRPDSVRPDSVRPDSVRPDSVRPDSVRADHGRVEASRVDGRPAAIGVAVAPHGPAPVEAGAGSDPVSTASARAESDPPRPAAPGGGRAAPPVHPASGGPAVPGGHGGPGPSTVDGWAARGDGDGPPTWVSPDGAGFLTGREERVVDQLLERARAAEPILTPLLRAVAAEVHGELVESNHVKEAGSLKAKVARILRDPGGPERPGEAAARIRDAVRYAVVFPESQYRAVAGAAIARLLDRGLRPVSESRHWDAGPGYAGVNTKWLHEPTGQVFEVQLHTPASWHAASTSHALYERIRAMPAGPERDVRLAEHDAHFAVVTVPAGAADVGLPDTVARHVPEPVAPDGPAPRVAGGPLWSDPRHPVTDAEAVALARQHVVATDAGLAFYPVDDEMRDFAAAVRPAAGYLTLDLHGSPTGFQIGDGLLTPHQFAAALLDLVDAGVLALPDGVGLKLISCDTASGGSSSPAAALARELGVEVIAPDQPVWTTAGGREIVSSPTLVAGVLLPTFPPDGSWVRFAPTGREVPPPIAAASATADRPHERMPGEVPSGPGPPVLPPPPRPAAPPDLPRPATADHGPDTIQGGDA